MHNGAVLCVRLSGTCCRRWTIRAFQPVEGEPPSQQKGSGMTKLDFNEASSVIVASADAGLHLTNIGGADGVGASLHGDNGNDGVGVLGTTGGSGAGVQGHSEQGQGVRGESAEGQGVHGESVQGRGVTGHSEHSDGVQGMSDSGTGVFGEGAANGLHGKSAAGRAVYGENTAGGDGIGGFSVSGTGTAGVSDSGTGLYGRSKSGNAGYFEGAVHVTGTLQCFDVVLAGRDCAEEFALGQAGDIEPGTVVVVDDEGGVRPSNSAYDQRVAGIVAGAGDLQPGILLADRASGRPGVPVSLFGTAYCKVDAQYAPIEVGDLLTTSPTEGHAMAVREVSRAFGSVLAKALRPHTGGQGFIPVLIALQ
jgi:hypothetical protein